MTTNANETSNWNDDTVCCEVCHIVLPSTEACYVGTGIYCAKHADAH